MRHIPTLLALAALAIATGCSKKEEAPAPVAGTPAAESKPMTGAPGGAASSYQAGGMPESVKQQLQQKGAPIK